MAKYMPGADLADANYVFAYSVSKTLMHVLEQCNGDFSRENVMKHAASIKDLELPTLLPGIKVSNSPTNYRPIRQMQLQRFNGASWDDVK